MAKISAGPFELLNGLVSGFQSGSQLAMQQQEMAMKRQAMDFDQSLKSKMQALEENKFAIQKNVWQSEIEAKQASTATEKRQDFIHTPVLMNALYGDLSDSSVSDSGALTPDQELEAVKGGASLINSPSPGMTPNQGAVKKGQELLSEPFQQKGGSIKKQSTPILGTPRSEAETPAESDRGIASIMPQPQQAQVSNIDAVDTRGAEAGVNKRQLMLDEIKKSYGEEQELDGQKGFYVGKGEREYIDKRMGSIAAKAVAQAKSGLPTDVTGKSMTLAKQQREEEIQKDQFKKTLSDKVAAKNADLQVENLTKIADAGRKDLEPVKQTIAAGESIMSKFLNKNKKRRDFGSLAPEEKLQAPQEFGTVMKMVDPSGRLTDRDVTILGDLGGTLGDTFDNFMAKNIYGKPLTEKMYNKMMQFVESKYNNAIQEQKVITDKVKAKHDSILRNIGKAGSYSETVKSNADSLSEEFGFGKKTSLKEKVNQPVSKTVVPKAQPKKEAPTRAAPTAINLPSAYKDRYNKNDPELMSYLKNKYGSNFKVNWLK